VKGFKPRLLPAGLGGLACAICCTLPILAATGVLGGGAVAAAVEGWLDALAAALIVTAVVLLALPVWRRRRRACTVAGCEGTCPSCETTLR
jgi:mercuric ion transport protein